MQLKIEGRNKLGQLKMVVLQADTITDGEVRNALQIVGFPVSTRHDPMDGHNVLRDIGEQDKHGKYITHADLAHEQDQWFIKGHKAGREEGHADGLKEGKKPCRRKHVADGEVKLAKREGYNEGYEAGKASCEIPEGFSVVSHTELADRINQAYERGKADGKVEFPSTFPIPADVWNGKHYGEFISIAGFPDNCIPAASEHGYEVKCIYLHKGAFCNQTNGAKSYVDPGVNTQFAEDAHANLVDEGYVPSLIVRLR